MSKSNFKGSLLATTIIAGLAIASPAFAQTPPAPDAPPPTTPPTNTQGTGAPATPSDEFPAAGVQSNEGATPAEPTSTEEIVVTGTLIRNPNLVASAPVTVVGQEELNLRQSNVAEEVLRTLPGQVPGVGSATNNGATGAATINLRGLGQQRSIALIDGVRLVPINLGSTFDLNNVPLALVDRIDVLTGGASSVYGADAVSGVVNFITRSDFAGMELSVADQITQRGDGNVLRADLTLGANFDDGRGNAVVSIGYQESDPVKQGFDRPGSMVANSAYDRFFAAGSLGSTPSGIALPGLALQQIGTGPDGAFTPFYAPFNFNPFNLFQTPFKRYNMYAAGHYDVAEGLTVYGRGLYSKNIIDTAIAPSGAFGGSVTVNLSNPFLSDAQRTFLCNNTDFNSAVLGIQGLTPAQCAAAATAAPGDAAYRTSTFGLYRRTVEAGPRSSNYTTNMFDFRAGIRGDITDSIGFDVFATRGESTRIQRAEGYVITSRIKQALLATNTTTCITATGGCVPLNIFGGPGTITPEMTGFIADAAEITTFVRRSQARGTINGDIGLTAPWAAQPISFAVGAEYRKDYGITRGDLLARQGVLAGFGGAVPTTEGALDVYEGFAELIAPIASDRPFFDELQLEAGIRRSKYTVDAPGDPTFKTTTYKVAGSWAPIADIKFRGNYNRAVRAPNIGELFAPQNTVLTGLVADPCQGAAPTTNPLLAAVCLAQGAPAGAVAGGTIPPPNSAQANITTGGNPFLQPETATSYTLGVVLRPSFLPGFNATLDYYNIKIKDAITVPSAQSLIDACFANLTAASATDPVCTRIRRNVLSGGLSGDPTEVPGIFGALTNAGKLATSGFDVTANYRRNLGDLFNSPARINISFNGNYTKSSKFQGFEGDVNRECAGIYGNGCLSGPALNIQPKYSFNVRPTLSLGKVDFSVLWRYIGKNRYDRDQAQGDIDAAEAANRDEDGVLLPLDEQGCPDYLGADPGGCIVDTQTIKARNYFDLTTRFNVNERFDMTFTIQNLFDKGPPSDFGTDLGPSSVASGNTFPNTYDAVGRRFGLGARVKF